MAEFKINYSTNEELEKILDENRHLYLIKDIVLSNEKYLIYTDIKPPSIDINKVEISLESRLIENENKISTLEAEKEQLKKINQEQDQLLVDNAYKITMLEMNMGGM